MSVTQVCFYYYVTFYHYVIEIFARQIREIICYSLNGVRLPNGRLNTVTSGIRMQ